MAGILFISFGTLTLLFECGKEIRDTGIVHVEHVGVGCDDEPAAGIDGGVGGEGKLEAFAEPPAGEIDVRYGGIIELDPFFENVGGGGMIKDLVDQDRRGGASDRSECEQTEGNSYTVQVESCRF